MIMVMLWLGGKWCCMSRSLAIGALGVKDSTHAIGVISKHVTRADV